MSSGDAVHPVCIVFRPNPALSSCSAPWSSMLSGDGIHVACVAAGLVTISTFCSPGIVDGGVVSGGDPSISVHLHLRTSRSVSRTCASSLLGVFVDHCWLLSSSFASSGFRPCWASSWRRCQFSSAILRFSSITLRAAPWISELASTPVSSHCRSRPSSSWRYSFLRARDRLWLSRMRARLALSYGAVLVGLLVDSARHRSSIG